MNFAFCMCEIYRGTHIYLYSAQDIQVYDAYFIFFIVHDALKKRSDFLSLLTPVYLRIILNLALYLLEISRCHPSNYK